MHPTDRPTILITAGSNRYTDRRGSPAVDWVISEQYALEIESAGATCLAVGPLARTNHEEERARSLASLMDGLVITGGAFDIPPQLYGAPSHPKSGPFDHARTELELALIREAVNTNKPILGICGGMQLLNVAFGGDLIQDLSLLDEALDHEQAQPRSEAGHLVKITPGTLLAECFAVDSLGVNSTHHQVIGRVASGLQVSAQSKDGVIEALESPSHDFMVGVQWHPEAMSAPEHSSLFLRFVEAARKSRSA